MMFTYHGDPGSNDLDAVRFLIGDTSDADPLLSDNEVLFCLANEGSRPQAAAAACEAIAAKFARLVDKQVGDLRISTSQRAQAYAAKGAQLRARGNIAVIPFAGGQSIADKTADRNNPDAVQPFFRRDTHDNPSLLTPLDGRRSSNL